jgi:hypothetical protein
MRARPVGRRANIAPANDCALMRGPVAMAFDSGALQREDSQNGARRFAP